MAKISDDDMATMVSVASLFAQRRDIRDQIQASKAKLDDVQAQIVVAKAAIRRVADALDLDPNA